MGFIEWTPDLSVHVKKIDDQHKKLFDIINQIYELSDFEKTKEKLDKVLNELIEYTRVHFSTEEKYFEKCNYPGTEEHIAEHMKLIEQVLDFKRRFDNDEDIISEFLDFIKSWLDDHLKTMDQKYVKNFEECGLE